MRRFKSGRGSEKVVVFKIKWLCEFSKANLMNISVLKKEI